MIKAKVGTHIRELRSAKGYSQDSFALKCGLHRTYIAGIETGKRNVSLENLCKIADALEISLSDLCNYEAPVHCTMLLRINGECFLMKTDRELTNEIKDEIEIICKLSYDEEECSIQSALSSSGYDSIYDASAYDIANAFQSTIQEQLGIHAVFKPIDFEAIINE